MKNSLLLGVLLIGFGLLAGCGDKTEKTTVTDGTALVVYEGKIPCYDCAGIQISLAIDENSELSDRAYRLTETFLESPIEDSIYSRFGSYQVIRGNTADSTAIIYEIDADLKHERYFIRVHTDTLMLADHKGDPILSPEPFYLIKTP